MGFPIFDLINAGVNVITGNQKRAQMEVENKQEEVKLKHEETKAERANAHEETIATISADSAYDVTAQQTAERRWDDDMVRIVFLSVFVLGFIPGMAEHVKAGWLAVQEAPWYYDFILIGIAVSSLGLKGFFKDFMPFRRK